MVFFSQHKVNVRAMLHVRNYLRPAWTSTRRPIDEMLNMQVVMEQNPGYCTNIVDSFAWTFQTCLAEYSKINALDALLFMDDSIPKQDYFAGFQVVLVLAAGSCAARFDSLFTSLGDRHSGDVARLCLPRV